MLQIISHIYEHYFPTNLFPGEKTYMSSQVKKTFIMIPDYLLNLFATMFGPWPVLPSVLTDCRPTILTTRKARHLLVAASRGQVCNPL